MKATPPSRCEVIVEDIYGHETRCFGEPVVQDPSNGTWLCVECARVFKVPVK